MYKLRFVHEVMEQSRWKGSSPIRNISWTRVCGGQTKTGRAAWPTDRQSISVNNYALTMNLGSMTLQDIFSRRPDLSLKVNSEFHAGKQ
jgi:hypothetical protein